jgi:hypothetical protein
MASPPERHSRFRVVFRGESDVLAGAFPNLTPEFRDGNTVLTGAILDRAQLQGILGRAESLGFELISVNPVTNATEGRDADQR